jgi:hypothetical protein
MLKPRMRVYSIDATEDILNLFHLLLQDFIAPQAAHAPRTQPKSRWKHLGRCEDRGSPVQGMTAVVDRGTAFRRVVDSTEILPFAGSHFWTCLRGAGRAVGEESDNNGIGFLYKEAPKLV